MSSGSDSGSNRSSRSGSPISTHGPAPTPGHGLEDRSPFNTLGYGKAQSERSRSPSVGSNKSGASGSQRSPSPNSQGSQSPSSQRSHSPSGSHHSRKSRSRSVRSNRSGSHRSNRSGSGSNNSNSGQSNQSGSRPGTPNSKRSGSEHSVHSNASRSGSRNSNKQQRSRSGSAVSNRSASPGSKASNRSRSGSAESKTSNRSRSGSAGSKRSESGSSESGKSNRSGSGSRSGGSSRSGSADSRKSGKSHKSRSRSRSASKSDRSRSNTPNLEIDEGPVEKRKLSDEESDNEVQGTKKKRIMDSDSENEKGKEVSAAAIFGDADDISSEEEKEKEQSDKEEDRGRSDDDDERRSDNEAPKEVDEYKEPEPEPIPETRIDVEIPKISCNLGRDIHFVKLPNFLSVETRPFDPDTYEDEIDEEETLDEEGRARLKLKVENTIRWREVMDDEGNIKKESNARIVRWSDGSYSLHLGSEIFDVYKQPLQGDHNHLFIRQGTGLQGQAVFRTKLSFRPHSTESFTHRKMTLSLADRSQKTSGIKILSQVGVDPDQDRYTRLKKEEEKLRQTARANKPRSRKDNVRSLSNRIEEDGSDDEGAISINAIKNKYKQGSNTKSSAATIYSSDEDGSDIEMKSKKQGKVLNIEESDESD